MEAKQTRGLNYNPARARERVSECRQSNHFKTCPVELLAKCLRGADYAHVTRLDDGVAEFVAQQGECRGVYRLDSDMLGIDGPSEAKGGEHLPDGAWIVNPRLVGIEAKIRKAARAMMKAKRCEWDEALSETRKGWTVAEESAYARESGQPEGVNGPVVGAVKVAAPVEQPVSKPKPVKVKSQPPKVAEPQPTPVPSKSADAADILLAALKSIGAPADKRTILARAGIDRSAWSDALSRLYRERKVRRVQGADVLHEAV